MKHKYILVMVMLMTALSPLDYVIALDVVAVGNGVREAIVPVTAYSSTPDQTDDTPFITANGTYVHDGVVAANFLPFGTKIKIPEVYGDKVFVVEDRMHKRFSQKVDIWFPDRESALEFGYQELKVQILED